MTEEVGPFTLNPVATMRRRRTSTTRLSTEWAPIRPSTGPRPRLWLRPPEEVAYVALLDPAAIAVVDVAPGSPTYGAVVGKWEPPAQSSPDEFHHYVWNICSSALGGDQHQMALEVRPAHDPAATYGFLGVVVDVTDLSASVWTWHKDGERVYVTNSLYSSWDPQFYPDAVPGAMAKINVLPGGGIQLDPELHVGFHGHRAHQVRLQGGDCSTDSFCFTS